MPKKRASSQYHWHCLGPGNLSCRNGLAPPGVLARGNSARHVEAGRGLGWPRTTQNFLHKAAQVSEGRDHWHRHWSTSHPFTRAKGPMIKDQLDISSTHRTLTATQLLEVRYL